MFDLERFVSAQASVYAQVLAELTAGRKRTHWMWFVFPQPAGLGLSAMSRRYAIASVAEADAYLAHAVLGARLLECTRAACAHRSLSALALFGHPDDLKFRSSMTLFAAVSPDTVFDEALEVFFGGVGDAAAMERAGFRLV